MQMVQYLWHDMPFFAPELLLCYTTSITAHMAPCVQNRTLFGCVGPVYSHVEALSLLSLRLFVVQVQIEVFRGSKGERKSLQVHTAGM